MLEHLKKIFRPKFRGMYALYNQIIHMRLAYWDMVNRMNDIL